jgi:hypothetical protein
MLDWIRKEERARNRVTDLQNQLRALGRVNARLQERLQQTINYYYQILTELL